MKHTAKRDLITNNEDAKRALEKNQLSLLVDDFSEHMKSILHEKVDQGFVEWDDVTKIGSKRLLDAITHHVEMAKAFPMNAEKASRHLVHVANLATITWNLKQ